MKNVVGFLRLCPAAVALCALLNGCGSVSVSVVPTLLITAEKPFLISKSSEAYGWGVLSHPRIVKLSDSNILVRYYVGGDNALQNDPAKRRLTGISPAISRDGGKTWVFGESHLDTNLAHASDYWGFDVLAGDDAILGSGGLGWRVRGEQVVDGPWPVSIQTNGFSSGGPWHRGACLSNGALVATSYYDTYEWKKGQMKSRIHLLRSDDGGKVWTVESQIADANDCPWGTEWSLGFEGPCEPCIAALPNDELICVARVGVKQRSQYEAATSAIRMLQARSRDGGKTWKHTVINREGVYPRLCRMRNGVLVLAFGRPGNNLVFGTGGGRIWGTEIALTPADAETTGYCDVVEVAPGKLLAVFDVHDTDLRGFWLWEPKPANGLYGVFVNVHKLLP